jgi:N-succinyl-L-ornithine transcarbamylase
MKNFTCIADVPRPSRLLDEAMTIKANPKQYENFGRHHTLVLVFFNPSLRTRISTEKAALTLGMQVISMNAQQGWNIEFEDHVVMDADRAEHIREAAAVISQYASIIGVRTFPGLIDREADYADKVLRKFVQFARVPVVSLESAIRHPLQSLADWMTIEEHKKVNRPKVVLSWAPHPRPLPQAVANSFLEWMKHAGVELVMTHPPGYELAEEFSAGIMVEHDQDKALEGADFVYTKNWSAYQDYGKVLHRDPSWMITPEKLERTNQAKFMHCLPVRRNVVVSDAVLDSESSLVLHQAHNRTFATQAVLKHLLDRITDDSGDYRYARSHLFE